MSVVIIGFAVWVILVMPLQAWLSYRQQIPSPSRWLIILQNLILISILWSLLNNTGVSREHIGLGNTSAVNLLLCTGLSTSVIVGLDIISMTLLERQILCNTSKVNKREKPTNSNFTIHPIPQDHELISFVPLCLIGSVWEELCFRGVALYLARSSWVTITMTVVVSSLIFGLHHLRQGINASIYSSFYGILFSVLYLTTQSLFSVIIAHIIGNLFVVFYVGPRLKIILPSTSAVL